MINTRARYLFLVSGDRCVNTARQTNDTEQHVERQAEADDRERFQNADTEEQEREDVRTSFRLARNRFDCFAGDEAVADGRSEGHAGHDERERDQRRRRN